jgi:HD domain
LSKKKRSEFVLNAIDFATKAHKQINHRRKYTQQPYAFHLKAVAQIVEEYVGDDDVMIAVAWLHDTVEDTPATHHDIEMEFGKEVAALVSDLTDISRPGDGNRAVRKAMDLKHIKTASPKAKTIKLADIIDNTLDIVKHDRKFAKVFIMEAIALLTVLKGADERLYKRAVKTVTRCAKELGIDSYPGSVMFEDDEIIKGIMGDEVSRKEAGFSQRRALKLFTKTFTAKDIAEHICSFDIERDADAVKSSLEDMNSDVSVIRRSGLPVGYIRVEDLNGVELPNVTRRFSDDQLVSGDAPLSDVIQVLTRHDYCFITILGHVSGVATKVDMEKPIVRMWLFGMITLIEMNMVLKIRELWPNGGWEEYVSGQRIANAKKIFDERIRRKQPSTLLDCLQLSDKTGILISGSEVLQEFGFETKGLAKQLVKDLESLRNNLAHGQAIADHDWPQIVRMTQQIERLVLSW